MSHHTLTGLLDSIEDYVTEIKEAYPKCRVIEEYGTTAIARLFIEEKRYERQKHKDAFDRAEFYTVLYPACFVEADIYNEGVYKATIEISSRGWHQRIPELENFVEKIAKGGLEAIANELNSEHLRVCRKGL